MASRAWPAVRILAEHEDHYQIQWEGDWLPTWEPKSNASERLVAAWVQQQKQRADGRGGGPGCYYAARRIVRERPKHYLVNWCPDECTGERYAPTWVHKKAATGALVAEWNKRKTKKKKMTTRRKGLAARTTGKRHGSPSSRHHDDDALPAIQEPPPQPQPQSQPLSRPQSSPSSAHVGLAQQQQQQLQLDAAESESSSSRRNPAPPATPQAMAKLWKLREQRRQASQQMPPASAVETMTEEQGEAGRVAWLDGMPDLSRKSNSKSNSKSVYGVRKRLFH